MTRLDLITRLACSDTEGVFKKEPAEAAQALADYADAILAVADEEPGGGGWVSVKERVPESIETVLICGRDNLGTVFVGAGWYVEGKWWEINPDPARKAPDATHWRPLPAPPKEPNGEA